MKNTWKYFIALLITAGIFATAFVISTTINQQKLETLQTTRDRIATDILSTETQFSLLAETSCKNIGTPVLSRELNSMARRLSAAEDNRSSENAELTRLKEYYSLLLIKDYLLGQRIAEKCDRQPISVLYFYSNEGDCPECQREGYVLTDLRQDHPELRVYAFDTNLNLSAIDTLKSMFDLKDRLPAIVINGEAYYGFQSRARLENLLPELEPATSSASTTGTTTPTTSSTTSLPSQKNDSEGLFF